MARSIIAKGATVEEAIESGLKELSLDNENADVEVLGNEEDLFVIKVTEHISDDSKISAFMNLTLDYIGADGTFDITKPDDEIIKVDVSGEDVSNLIGKRGDTLYAVSYLSNIIVNKGKEKFKKVIVDCENYRAKKEKKLVELANAKAAQVCKYRKTIQLQPMPAAERRIIHETLQSNRMVETESYGSEPNRCVVIRLKPYTKVI